MVDRRVCLVTTTRAYVVDPILFFIHPHNPRPTRFRWSQPAYNIIILRRLLFRPENRASR